MPVAANVFQMGRVCAGHCPSAPPTVDKNHFNRAAPVSRAHRRARRAIPQDPWPRAQNGEMVELAALDDEGNVLQLGCDAGQVVARSRAVKDPPVQFWLSPLATAPAAADFLPVAMLALIEIFERYAYNNELDRLSARCHIRYDKEPNRDHGSSQQQLSRAAAGFCHCSAPPPAIWRDADGRNFSRAGSVADVWNCRGSIWVACLARRFRLKSDDSGDLYGNHLP
jgi:hypothetical protein